MKNSSTSALAQRPKFLQLVRVHASLAARYRCAHSVNVFLDRRGLREEPPTPVLPSVLPALDPRLLA
jgi:hypothetical protein